MEKKKEEKKRVRREYAKRGERSGKMMAFRADFRTIRLMENVVNKSRLINDLVTAWSEGRKYEGDEIPPQEGDIEEYFQ